MNQILKITYKLTLSCLAAAFVMGAVFTVTDRAKKHNEHMNVQDTMVQLLGYNKTNPVPSDLELFNVYRYIIEDGDKKSLGYMIPVEKEGKKGYDLLVIDLKGDYVDRMALGITPEEAVEEPDRKKALAAVLKSPIIFTYADATVIAKQGDKRMAYLLPGEFPGFKTFITVMLALDPAFNILGLEIMEHEEDPGLGAEIEQGYFKNQFKGKRFERLKDLKVVKEPMPEEYRLCLETQKNTKGAMTEAELNQIRGKYEDKDIYALTGATISSNSVTSGVKGMVKKFAYRIKILDQVIENQKIAVAF